jgi:hypothetical protein
VHPRLKDQELILRFFALFEARKRYERPMGEFLNKYAGRERASDLKHLERLAQLFRETIDVFNSALQATRPFRLTSALNVAVFDSCMVGMATRLSKVPHSPVDPNKVREQYQALLKDSKYLEAVSRSTADAPFVTTRLSQAISYFDKC